ncbi:MAG: 6,7-dimethyl-8-ribityllumazine synthase [Lentisphaerae bacterium]|jgi:6,7-dimethyl-8-ribityllumazine synthase|nr:6,7-dimethyl-8-ribityllumazine synthase [Lentisphaerota bacterium]
MKIIEGILQAQDKKFGIVISRFNSFFTEQLLKGAQDCLARHGAADEDITVVRVPGASEIPIAAQRIAKSKKFDAVIALGCVIQGATPHAELINTQVARALASIGLEYDVPVINGLVAANTIEQAVERSGTKAGNKGWDAAAAAIEIVAVLNQI